MTLWMSLIRAGGQIGRSGWLGRRKGRGPMVDGMAGSGRPSVLACERANVRACACDSFLFVCVLLQKMYCLL